MADSIGEVKRDELLRAIQVDWGEYLPVLRALSHEQQMLYASEQGFKNLRDFLIHVAAWWSKAIEVVAVFQYSGLFPLHDEDDDEFNARMIERYAHWMLEDAEKYFKITWLAICGMVSHLPDSFLENPVLNRWLYEIIILHYDRHVSPAMFRKRFAA
jgi:hypothetical protein